MPRINSQNSTPAPTPNMFLFILLYAKQNKSMAQAEYSWSVGSWFLKGCEGQTRRVWITLGWWGSRLDASVSTACHGNPPQAEDCHPFKALRETLRKTTWAEAAGLRGQHSEPQLIFARRQTHTFRRGLKGLDVSSLFKNRKVALSATKDNPGKIIIHVRAKLGVMKSGEISCLKNRVREHEIKHLWY